MSINQRMTKLRRPATAILAVLITAGVTLPMEAAFAQDRSQEDEDRRRSRQTLTERSGRTLAEAINLINEEPPQTQEALNRVNDLLSRNLPPYDRATALEVRGQLYFQLDNLDAALRDFVEVLNIDALPSARQRQIRRNVAQLYYTQERYGEAISFMQQYIREAGSEAEANDYFILSAAHVQTNNYSAARSPAETAVRLDQQANTRNKQFYDLLNLVYNELGLEAERGRLLETMVEYFPGEASYWEQLAGAYATANRRADALAALEVAYKAGLIDEEDKIVALSQYYYDQNNPYRGALLLETEMNAGNVERDLANLELLAQLWAASREQEKAIAILTEAAPKRDDGRLYYQLGQSYLADEEYGRAVSNLRNALRRGGLDDRETGNAYVLIGTALFQQDSDTTAGRQAARAEFVRARNYSNSARTAGSWIEYIDTIEDTLRRQAQVERSQAIERQRRQIERCQTILDVIELGGQTEVPPEQIATCRELSAKVDAGATPESLVDGETPEGEEAEAEDTEAETEGEAG